MKNNQPVTVECMLEEDRSIAPEIDLHGIITDKNLLRANTRSSQWISQN